MQQHEPVQIDVLSEMVADLRAAVAAGEFSSVSEAVQRAVEDWQAKRALAAWDVEELRRLVQDGAESGPGIEAATVFARLRASHGLV